MKDRHGDNEIDTSFINNPEVRREETDVNIRPILWFGLWLMVGGGVVTLLVAGLYNYFEKREGDVATPRPAFADERKQIPAEPRLQLAPNEAGQARPDFIKDHPLMDMRELREKEDAVLNGYGWVDQQNGVAHIPIEEAMKLAIQQGQQLLPSKPGSQPQPAEPSGRPAEGGAGHVTTGGERLGRPARRADQH